MQSVPNDRLFCPFSCLAMTLLEFEARVPPCFYHPGWKDSRVKWILDVYVILVPISLWVGVGAH